MTMTILQGWPEDEPILELPVDDWDYEAAREEAEKEGHDPLADLVDGPVIASCDLGRVEVTMSRYSLTGMLGAFIFG